MTKNAIEGSNHSNAPISGSPPPKTERQTSQSCSEANTGHYAFINRHSATSYSVTLFYRHDSDEGRTITVLPGETQYLYDFPAGGHRYVVTYRAQVPIMSFPPGAPTMPQDVIYRRGEIYVEQCKTGVLNILGDDRSELASDRTHGSTSKPVANNKDNWLSAAECLAAETAPFYQPALVTRVAVGKNEVIKEHPTGGCFELDLPDRLNGRGFVRLEMGRRLVYDGTNNRILRLAGSNNSVYSWVPFVRDPIAANDSDPSLAVKKDDPPKGSPILREIVGVILGIDVTRDTILLRDDAGQTYTLSVPGTTPVVYRNATYRPRNLENGDRIRIQWPSGIGASLRIEVIKSVQDR